MGFRDRQRKRDAGLRKRPNESRKEFVKRQAPKRRSRKKKSEVAT